MTRFALPAILLLLSIAAVGCDDATNTDTSAMDARPSATVQTALNCPGKIVNGMCDYTTIKK
jgi:hypothetical protein